MTTESTDIAIVGAGLAGCLAATFFARRGHQVTLYERRPDSRVEQIYEGRSVNLALSVRGFTALERAGLKDQIMAIALPMYGRQLHARDGSLTYQPYGLKDQAIYSVSRRRLNEILLDLALSVPGVSAKFNCRLDDLDFKAGKLQFFDTKKSEEFEAKSNIVVGADGAYSAVRVKLQKTRFNFQQRTISHGYKELRVGPTPSGDFAFNHERFHIWPRDSFMLIALPNIDKSFTVTLFMNLEGPKNSFEALKTPEQVKEFFEYNFPDAMPYFTDLVGDFFNNPTSFFLTVRCDPYHMDDKVVLVGDAAHAVVPFYGQGINCGFEDCRVLDELLEQYGNDYGKIFPEYSKLRKENCETISDMALEHFNDMAHSTNSKLFLAWRAVERSLVWLIPTIYRSEYSMVSFSNIPYAQARQRVQKQEKILRYLVSIMGLGTLSAALKYTNGSWFAPFHRLLCCDQPALTASSSDKNTK